MGIDVSLVFSALERVFKVPNAEIDRDRPLLDCGLLDSLAIVTLIAELEAISGRPLSNEDAFDLLRHKPADIAARL